MAQRSSYTAATAGPGTMGMTPEYLPARTTRTLRPAAIAPLAMLGLGLAGAATWYLRRKKEDTWKSRITKMLDKRYDQGVELAQDAREFAAQQAEGAVKTGRKLFKRGRKVAETTSTIAREEGQKLAEEGQQVAHKGLRVGKQAAKVTGYVAAKQAQAIAPLVRGLLMAAAIRYGEKLLERRHALAEAQNGSQASEPTSTSKTASSTKPRSRATTKRKKAAASS